MSAKELASVPGMTLRDWFAGQVFASAISSAQGLGEVSKSDRMNILAQVATIACESADAMITARSGDTK